MTIIFPSPIFALFIPAAWVYLWESTYCRKTEKSARSTAFIVNAASSRPSSEEASAHS